jgi:transcriptional regulator with XRE-family HTH domain
MITGRQIAAARALLGLSQGELARASNISIPTIKRLEGTLGPAQALPNNLAAIRTALETAGVQFLDNGTVAAGVGVALKASI